MKEELLKLAVEEAKIGIDKKDGGPFGAVITDSEGNIIAKGHNKVLVSKDPTNHAEVVAIREACKRLNTSDLSGYKIYSSCEPCPMCLSAIIWSNIKEVYYGAGRCEANNIGFRDKDIYDFLDNKNEIIYKEQVESSECINLLNSYEGERY